MNQQTTNPQCTIRGHNHALELVRTLTQEGTGLKGNIWQCPSGYYRWFALEGRIPSDATRMKRPRWGWRD